MSIRLTPCEPTMENFRTNVKTIDPYNDLKIMVMVITSFYKINENQTPKLTPKDVECCLRDEKMNVNAFDHEDPSHVLVKIQEQIFYSNNFYRKKKVYC